MIFEPADRPRVFGLPPGADFGALLRDGLVMRCADPLALARCEIWVNTRRMERRLQALFSEGPPRLLPRLRVITDLAQDPLADESPLPEAALMRRLELTAIVSELLDLQPDLAPRASLFALAQTLAGLFDEMHGEGVPAEALDALDISDESGHWQRALAFLRIAQRFDARRSTRPGSEQRQRAAVLGLIARWQEAPPDHPVILAGSTGSRGATRLLMEAVAGLPQGAVVLPGFDFDLPAPLWAELAADPQAEDHPQFRFAHLMAALGLDRPDIAPWHKQPAPSPARNALISLSLRPAPVTDQWLSEGPHLNDLGAATEGITLVEAPTPRLEAEAIALRLRTALHQGQRAALISPDRTLTRQVTAALDRWRILPDDSAGLPLDLSPPGRLLRQVANLCASTVGAADLLALLKHPLVHRGAKRGPHLMATRQLELHLRRHGPAYPDAAALQIWAERPGHEALLPWAKWIGAVLTEAAKPESGPLPLATHLARLEALAEQLSQGSSPAESDAECQLWTDEAGAEARRVLDDLQAGAELAADLSARDFASLLAQVLAGSEIRRAELANPDLLIWGTLEARVQSADLVILGGLTEGIWPEPPQPDPWLNRAMRRAVGLLPPERRIGLAAHDYQQAVAAREVWITRAIRSEEAETVPSRWLNRLLNLLGGLEAGKPRLAEMRARGQSWIARAEALGHPEARLAAAPRPAPRVPSAARPGTISVTQVTTLIRDPYAIYAQKVLGLRPLDPLIPEADAPLRGILIHAILQDFIAQEHDPTAPDAPEILMKIADKIFAEGCPWPSAQRQWRARFRGILPWILETEALRRANASPALLESRGDIALTGLPVTLTARADRIDRTETGQLIIYDYKTGTPPSQTRQRAFDKQLLLSAAMAERGAFDLPAPHAVAEAAFIGLGASPAIVPAPLEAHPPGKVWEDFVTLMQRWQDPTRGYTARMAPHLTFEHGDYDHLSRYGEWDETMPPTPEDMA